MVRCLRGIAAGGVAFCAAAFLAVPSSYAEAESKPGLPQLDPSTYPSQLFWLVVSFGALYLLMSRVALPAVQQAQDNRRGKIRGDIDAAAAANAEAKLLNAALEKDLADVQSRARGIVNDAMVAVTKETAVALDAKQHELSERVKEVEQRISAERVAVLKDAPARAGEIASEIVEKIAGFKLGAAR